MGFMGSGKSTLGPVLAARLSYSFVDLDERIAEVSRKPIAVVFEEDGEATFRVLEAHALKETRLFEHLVVAAGGGALLNQKSLRVAKADGVVVYLRLAAEALTVRLEGVASRPLLLDSDGETLSGTALLDRVKVLLAARLPFYEQADLIVDIEDLSPDAIVEVIVGALNERV